MREKKYNNIIKEGEIWKVSIPKSEYGKHIQYGEKYIVVMSNNMNNLYSSNISCVVLTSKKKDKHLPVHYTFKAGELEGMWLDTTVLGETYAPIDKNNFMERMGKVTSEQMSIIANCIANQAPSLFFIQINNNITNFSYA
jgi:mRNA-degrading endonuclease toxin of MazEF toxin-antitoxin module